jgi:hypothetical protein
MGEPVVGHRSSVVGKPSLVLGRLSLACAESFQLSALSFQFWLQRYAGEDLSGPGGFGWEAGYGLRRFAICSPQHFGLQVQAFKQVGVRGGLGF